MLILIALLSSGLAVIALLVGLIFLFLPKKKVRVLNQTEKEAEASTDEEKSIWQWLGFVDNTPNTIRAIVAGNERSGPIIGYISNVPGKIYDPVIKRMRPISNGDNPYMRPDKSGNYVGEQPWETYIRQNFGKRYIGTPIITGVRPLTIDRVVQKSTGEPLQNKDGEKTQLKATFVKRYSLYEEIQRPTEHTNVDTKDGFRFNVTSYAILHVVNPEPAFNVYPDSLLQTISNNISAFISAKVINIEWEDYKAKYKGEGKSRFDIEGLNDLLSPMGVEVQQITMSDPELNKDIQADVEAEAKAIRQARAKEQQGIGEKKYKMQIAEGDAWTIERIAKAKKERQKQLYDFYVEAGYRPQIAVEMSNDMVAKEFTADAISKLTTYAPSDGKNPASGVNIIVPGGEKKG